MAEEETEEEKVKFHVFKARGGWTWVLRDDGLHIDGSAFGLWTNKAACVRAVEALKTMIPECEIVED